MQIKQRTEQRRLADLKDHPGNSRTHSGEQIEELRASFREFGYTATILVDETDTILAGHGRREMLQLEGVDEVTVVVLDGLTDAQKRAYVIADNQLPMNADWDLDALRREILDLQELDFDTDVLGFDTSFLDDLLAEALPPEPPAAVEPDTAGDPVTVPGDVWILGKHRVMCGDSTSVDAVDALMAGDTADLLFTDPPYGMSYGGGRARGDHSRDSGGGVKVKAHGMIMGDDLRGDDLVDLVRDALATARPFCESEAAAYVCFTWRTYAQFLEAVTAAGFEVAACIVWDKGSIGLGTSNYRPQHEFIFYCPGAWHGDRAESDVWSFSRGATGEYVHPTQKPVALVERAVSNSTRHGGVVLDLFGGSGSTLVACERKGRAGYLMELDPKYVDAIVSRWQVQTGQQAVHQDTGLPFSADRS